MRRRVKGVGVMDTHVFPYLTSIPLSLFFTSLKKLLLCSVHGAEPPTTNAITKLLQVIGHQQTPHKDNITPNKGRINSRIGSVPCRPPEQSAFDEQCSCRNRNRGT